MDALSKDGLMDALIWVVGWICRVGVVGWMC